MQILFYSLLALGFFGGNILRLEFGNGYALTFLDIATILTSLYILITQYRHIILHPLFRPLLILLSAFILSLLLQLFHYTPFELLQGLSYIIRFGIYGLLMFFPLSSSKSNIVLTIVGAMTVALGFMQYFFYPMLRNLYYLGWDEHLYRLFGSFLDPNFMGIFLSLFLLFCLDRLWVTQSDNLAKVLYATLSPLTLVGLFLTFSRESYILSVIGIGAYTLLTKKINLKLLAAGFILLISITIIFLIFGPKSEGTKLFRTASLYQRFESDAHAVSIFQKHSLFGVGFNTYRYAQKEAGFTNSDNWLVSHAGSGPENSYLLVLATTGITGFGVYIYFWGNVLIFAHTSKQRSLLLSSLITFLLSGLFINSLFYPFLLVWIWLLIAAT